MAGEVTLRFGQRLRQRRLELKLTQKQVAARMPSGADGGPVDAQRISDWERGYNEPSDRYKLELVGALEVPDVSYFYEAAELSVPDLSAVLDGNEDSQLERIEKKLDAILEALTPTTKQQADQLARALLAAGQAVRLEPEAPAPAKPVRGRRARAEGDAAG